MDETGTITIGPKSSDVFFSNLPRKKNENIGANVDTEHLMNQWTIQFSFHTFKSLDGVLHRLVREHAELQRLTADNGRSTALSGRPRASRRGEAGLVPGHRHLHRDRLRARGAATT